MTYMCNGCNHNFALSDLVSVQRNIWTQLECRECANRIVCDVPDCREAEAGYGLCVAHQLEVDEEDLGVPKWLLWEW